MGRVTLTELAKHFDFSCLNDISKNVKPARIIEYGEYLKWDNDIHELTGFYIEELLNMFAAGWGLVPPKEPMKMSDLMKGE